MFEREFIEMITNLKKFINEFKKTIYQQGCRKKPNKPNHKYDVNLKLEPYKLWYNLHQDFTEYYWNFYFSFE